MTGTGSQAERRLGAGSAPVRFATFNVLHGRRLQHGRPPAVPCAGTPEGPLVEAIGSLDADVLALQEVDRLQERSGCVDQAVVAAGASGARDWRYASALHGRSVPGRGWVLEPGQPELRVYGPQEAAAGAGVPSHGIALLSRLPVLGWRARRFAAAPLGLPLRVAARPGLTLVRDQPRAALAAVLEGRRGPFTVAVLHLSFVPGWNLGQLLAVRRWIADLPQPQVLLGDFNLVGAVPGLALGAAGLLGEAPRRPWRELARTPSYPAHRPLVQFDHVLGSGIGPDAVGAVCAPLMPVSDHRPVVVELSL